MSKATLGAKGYAGVTLLAASPSITDSILTTYFMVYMTDYSGLGPWAAVLAGTVLIAARIFDFFCAPAVGIYVGRAKGGRFGKYRPFLLLSMCLATLGVFLIFHVPEALGVSKPAAFVYVLAAYLIYDVGASFNMPTLLYRSMTTDTGERGQLLIGPRYTSLALGVLMSLFITGAGKINAAVGNMHRSVGIVVSLYLGLTLLVSLLGLAMVRERHAAAETAARVSLKDVILVFRENEAFRVRTLSTVFSGFVWTMLFSSVNYYVKWTYCADQSTGAVDAVVYGHLIMVSGLLTLLPILVGSAIAAPLMRWVGSPDRFTRILLLFQTVPLGALFLLHLLGVTQQSYVLFFSLVGVAAFAIGCNFMPENVMAMESMDYDVYKNGIDRGPIYHAVGSLIGKLQTTFSSVAIAWILTSIGYVVDAKTDTFLGDLTQVPQMLTGFTVIMALIPALLSLVAFLILLKYPVTREIREEMSRM